MVSIASTLLVLALMALLLGFGPLTAEFAAIAQILFFVFVVLFLVSAAASVLRGRPPGGA